ncbi:hypothetical protein MNAN1_002212 [Malassezia nana]|uniref:Metal homeostatis protein BSD2 n=1 Tax=Malassezia nana TaxID=180528 RepID=A0AAF0J2K8_9BASI|nr:hypothetical protein MNAN1_002212 [Malassezia nana]
MGSGIHQDGVFSNMNAKPERVRESLDPHDRGDNDDLVDETSPPTYETAAADAAPTYWESTVFGANSIADTETAWSPNGTYVGDVDAMIVGTMTIGTVFALLWNMFISGTFQFIGFVLTFLLHTTHAAKLGSRAGLGISLFQYGVELLRGIDLSVKEAHKKNQIAKESNSSATITLPSEAALSHSKFVCRFIAFLGLILIVQSVLTYLFMYRKSYSLVQKARRQEREQALQALPPENQPSSAEESPLPRSMMDHIRALEPLGLIRRAFERWREAVVRDLNTLGPTDAEVLEEGMPRPYVMSSRGVLLFSINDAILNRHSDQPYPHPVTVAELHHTRLPGASENSSNYWRNTNFL